MQSTPVITSHQNTFPGRVSHPQGRGLIEELSGAPLWQLPRIACVRSPVLSSQMPAQQAVKSRGRNAVSSFCLFLREKSSQEPPADFSSGLNGHNCHGCPILPRPLLRTMQSPGLAQRRICGTGPARCVPWPPAPKPE